MANGDHDIKDWRSIVTLIVFVITNVIVLFPFHIPIYIPKVLSNAFLDILSATRIIAPRQDTPQDEASVAGSIRDADEKPKWWETHLARFWFPMDFVTAPLIADLFLLAIQAIGREEIHDGTVGVDDIQPIDIMVFFITLAYIAISIDASGLIRYLAFKVLQKGGENGHRLYFYLYLFFFALTSFIGNDPIVLSGTAFLAYMTRVASNIKHPRAWIYMQFAVANCGSAILVSSNPTNLVLAGAFKIKFIVYTANIIVPVVVTGIVLFPFLLWIVFPYESLIPSSISLHELSQEEREKKPVNPNIPYAGGSIDDDEVDVDSEEKRNKLLGEIMNPFLDKGGAGFGAGIMAVTLVTILALNAAAESIGHHPVFYITLPAAFITFCWDVGYGWKHRHETREIAQEGRINNLRARAERLARANQEMRRPSVLDEKIGIADGIALTQTTAVGAPLPVENLSSNGISSNQGLDESAISSSNSSPDGMLSPQPKEGVIDKEQASAERIMDLLQPRNKKATLASKLAEGYRWLQDTFPTVMAVLSHLPVRLVPFALCMFVLVQALATKGWVPVFAHGWDHWVNKTGTIGAIGGMGFLSVIMCNFAGTNIGTTILLCRVIQRWVAIRENQELPIPERTFWATVYSMALGVNYGAFSTAFSASLAGLLWRDILRRKHIHVKASEFARVNIRIIAFAMAVGCAVLVGEVYIVRDTHPYKQPKG